MEVRKPLFIVGFPRSGTTYLHRILDRDTDQFSSLKLWEILLAPSILQKKLFLWIGKLDHFMGKQLAGLVIRLENRIFSGSRSMHKIGLFEAEEDELILIHIFSSLFQGFMLAFEEMNFLSRFDKDVPEANRKKIMNFYRRCIQRHLYVFDPDKRFLSKNPVSSCKINSMDDVMRAAGDVFAVDKAVGQAAAPLAHGLRKTRTRRLGEALARSARLIGSGTEEEEEGK